MILCDHDCPGPICDFCRFLERTSKIDEDPEGLCHNPNSPKYQQKVEWDDACDAFHCFSADP